MLSSVFRAARATMDTHIIRMICVSVVILVLLYIR